MRAEPAVLLVLLPFWSVSAAAAAAELLLAACAPIVSAASLVPRAADSAGSTSVVALGWSTLLRRSGTTACLRKLALDLKAFVGLDFVTKPSTACAAD